MNRKQAQSTLQIEDNRVKVTRWDFSPNSETGWHTHQMNYIVVPLTNGTLTAELPDGSLTESELTIGSTYSRPRGVSHNIINSNNDEFSFIEIELK